MQTVKDLLRDDNPEVVATTVRRITEVLFVFHALTQENIKKLLSFPANSWEKVAKETFYGKEVNA